MKYLDELKAYKKATIEDIGKIASKGYGRTTPSDEAILARKLAIWDGLCDLIEAYSDSGARNGYDNGEMPARR
ncbi:MAG: hypothetical protein LBE35_02105 [Clostridiales bacterium]|jgi:hypothetical protein|nr:hypothetical protein [Clostridiales bacterium]